MKLASIRGLVGLRPVLKDPDSSGPDPVYWVFSDISPDKFANITIISPGNFSQEYPKTFGHYHSVLTNETYKVIFGEGVLLLQKKHLENGLLVPGRVDEVFLIKAQAGDELIITPEYGHSWANTSNEALILADTWREGHTPADYEPIEKTKGLAYYLVENNGSIVPLANNNYHNLPEPKWLTAAEWKAVLQGR